MNKKAQLLLSEARDLLAAAEEKQASADSDRWAAAERMWKANREEGVNTREIARAVGFKDHSTAARHINVWDKHRSVAQSHRPSYTEAYYEAQSTTRIEKYESATRIALREADEDTVTKIVASLPPDRQAVIARAAIRSAPREVASDPEVRHAIDEATPSEERAERTRRALRDPGVARHVVQDDAARSAMARAAKEMEEQAGERQRERAPGLVGMSDFYQATGELSRMRQAGMKSLDAMRKLDLSDDQRESLKDDHGRVKLVSEWIDSYLESGDHSFDEELNRLLREEA